MIEVIKDEKQGAAPYQFAQALALSIMPDGIAESVNERLAEQIAMAALSSAVTGEETKIEITIQVKDCMPHGLHSKMVSESYDKLKAMSEDEMVKAVLPTLVQKLKNDAARDAIQSFNLSDMLRDIMENDEDGDEEEEAPAESEKAA